MADLSSHQTIREAIQKISFHGFVNPETGSFRGTNKIEGFVAKIHTDGPLKGTIDVQERNTLAMSQGDDDVKVGYHEGVRLSAIQDNSKGYVIVPKLYSDVVISQDPDSYTEYVYMYSRVDLIQLDSHETITIGVKEREEYNPNDENAPTVRKLPETNAFSRTTYTKDSVTTEIQDKDKNICTKHLINSEKAQFLHDKSEIVIDGSQSMMKYGDSAIQIKDGSVFIDSGSGTEDSAVLGKALAGILSDMVGAVLGMVITSPVGPCTIDPNTIASLTELQTKLGICQSSGDGEFLTNKIKIKG